MEREELDRCEDAVSLCSSATSGTKCSIGPLQSMAARDELRRRRREELKARYENIKKQKETELKARLQREAELEKLQRKAYVEQKKLAEKQRLEKEEEKKRQRELCRQQMELSILHCSRKKLFYYGMLPWKKLLLNRRTKMEQSWKHLARVLEKKVFKLWDILLTEKHQKQDSTVVCFRERWCQLLCLRLWFKTLNTAKFYTLNLVKRAIYGFKQVVEDRMFYEEASIICNQMRLYKFMWTNWKIATTDLKNEFFLKDQVAKRHANRASCARSLKAWKYAVSDELSEKNKQRNRAETWAKINTWLEEYHQEKKNSVERNW